MSEHQQVVELLASILTAQQDNTVAITKLAEALAGIRSKVEAAKVETVVAIEKAKGAAPLESQSAVDKNTDSRGAPPVPTLPANSGDAQPLASAAPAPQPSYEDARKVLAAIERSKALATLTQFKVARLSDLDPSLFAQFMEACRG